MIIKRTIDRVMQENGRGTEEALVKLSSRPPLLPPARPGRPASQSLKELPQGLTIMASVILLLVVFLLQFDQHELIAI